MILLITGPESSGKSTLAKSLSLHFDFDLVDEYAREYLETNGGLYCEEDLLDIAKGHVAIVENFTKEYNLILDTYLLNIKIWSEAKYGKCHPWILKQLQAVKIDHTLLLKPNIAWHEDPLRENSENRNELFDKFEDNLKAYSWDYDIIDQVNDDRTHQAIQILSEKLFTGNQVSEK